MSLTFKYVIFIMCEILRAPGTQQNEYYVRDGAETVRKKVARENK